MENHDRFISTPGGRLTRILAFDGGGIRGIMPAYFLKQAARHFKFAAPHLNINTLSGHCELLAGTSTGSLIACLLADGTNPSEILKHYIERAQQIFTPVPSGWFWGIADGACYYDYAKFDPRGIEDGLKEVFKEKTLGDLKIPTLVVAYNVNERKPVVFKSWNEKHKATKISDVCAASSAAPGHFPPVTIKVGDVKYQFVDGGLAANNPALCAVAEAMNVQSTAHLLSFGTGERLKIGMDTTGSIKSWGGGAGLLDASFSAPNSCVDYIARTMLGERYQRIDFALHDEVPLDSVEPTIVQLLMQRAEAFCDSDDGLSAIKFMDKMLNLQYANP